MRKLLQSIIVWSALLAATACGGSLRLPAHTTPTPPPETAPAPTASYTIAAVVKDQNGALIRGASVVLEPGAVTYAPTNGDGFTTAQVPIGTYTLQADTECCGVVRSEPFTVRDNATIALVVTRPELPKPWLTITDAELRAWRGSISTTVMAIPCGPRPNQPNNVMFTAEFGSSCWSPDDKARAIAAYGAKGWKHWPIGPVESRGYHDRYPDQNWIDNPDGFADLLEQLWRSGKIPVLFLLPDTGFCADGREIDRECVETRLTPFYKHPRIQELTRIVAKAWEPEYTFADHVWASQWAARVFPHALWADHEPSGHSAPCRGSELVEGGGSIANEGACWAGIAPWTHLYLQQETWTFGGETGEGRAPLQQFLYNLWDTGHRFEEGSWPMGAGGKPIKVVAYEYGSFHVTNNPELAEQSARWGDAAISAEPFLDAPTGRWIDAARYVTGYGDGGTLDPALVRARRTFSAPTHPSTSSRLRFSFTVHPITSR